MEGHPVARYLVYRQICDDTCIHVSVGSMYRDAGDGDQVPARWRWYCTRIVHILNVRSQRPRVFCLLPSWCSTYHGAYDMYRHTVCRIDSRPVRGETEDRRIRYMMSRGAYKLLGRSTTTLAHT